MAKPRTRAAPRGPDGLTARQRALYEFIRDYWHEHGRPPTIRSCYAVVDTVSPNGVMAHIRTLVKKGLLAKRTTAGNRAVYAPAPSLEVRPRAGGVLVGSVAGAVSFTRAQWADWLRAELKKVTPGARPRRRAGR